MAANVFLRSRAWRRMVYATRESAPAMFAFTGAMCVGFGGLGYLAMVATNPENDERKHAVLRERATLEHKVLAKVQKERLAALFGEIQNKEKGDEVRWRDALDGRTTGDMRATSLPQETAPPIDAKRPFWKLW